MKEENKQNKKSILSYTWEPHDMPMTPHLIYVTAEACIRVKHAFGYAFEAGSFLFKDKMGRWGFTEEDLDRTGEFLFRNPQEVLSRAKLWEEKLRVYNEIAGKLRNLDKLSDKELLRLHSEFYDAYVDEYAIPMLANCLDFYFENWLKAHVENQEDFLTLTTPTKESFLQKEAKELLSIKKDSNFQENIGQHARKYHWLSNTYAQAKILGKDYFIRRHETEQHSEMLKAEKRELMKKYGISENLMKAVEECIYWRDERKKYNMISDHIFCLFLEEFGKRNNLSLEDMKYTLPKELGNIDKKEIEMRKSPFLLFVTKDKDIFYYGEEAQELHDKMYKVQKGEVKEIVGRPACLGRARGTVRVIMDESEFHKMQQGDILVTSMTRPEFVPIMKKAAAIVTDEGGITCHAAIVSRELNIPCIISTRIATKTLKDGDEVDVDAEKGIVRKI